MLQRLSEKVVLITGSTTGIGKAIAARCVAEGARVVIHGLEEDLAEAVVSDLGADSAVSEISDLKKSDTVESLVQLAIDTYGRLDAVVNNAAQVGTGNLHTTDEELFLAMLRVNTLVPFLLTKAALPHLRESKGSVLNIGSVNAYCGEPDLLPYSVSKGALMTLTRNLGDTLFREDGVRVNQINPGWVLTENEALRKQEQGLGEDWEKTLPDVFAPAGRILRPDEIAAAAVYWLADESGPISGQVVDLEQHPFIGRNPPKDGEALGN